MNSNTGNDKKKKKNYSSITKCQRITIIITRDSSEKRIKTTNYLLNTFRDIRFIVNKKNIFQF